MIKTNPSVERTNPPKSNMPLIFSFILELMASHISVVLLHCQLMIGASEFVLCLDNDSAGQRGARKLKKALSRVAIVRMMTIPPRVDPQSGEEIARDANDLSKEEFYNLEEIF